MRISDWISDVCSSDLPRGEVPRAGRIAHEGPRRKQGDQQDLHAPLAPGVREDLRHTGHWGGADDSQNLLSTRAAGHQPRSSKKIGAGQPSHHERSEEHPSELPSLMRTSYAVFCLKKKHNPEPT